MLGISIKHGIGLGDGIQFSSAPENYFRATGLKLVDVSRPWFFDANPFVLRPEDGEIIPERVVELWNFCPTKYPWPRPRQAHQPQVYHSNAEIWAAVFGVPQRLNRPRLYRFEDYDFCERSMILFHVDGKSHGRMPDHVIEHVLHKYRATGQLFAIGAADPKIDIPYIRTESLWELAQVISRSRMLIGMDSGPAWIAACYPDVVTKILRSKPSIDVLQKDWIPLAIDNIHSHWDDRCRMIYNPTEESVGFTTTFKDI